MSKTQKPNKGGRPRVDTEAVTLRLPREMINQIDGFRRHAMDLPTRPEAIRRLLQAGMDVSLSADMLINEIKADYQIAKEYPRVSELISILEKNLSALYTAAKSNDILNR